MMYKLQHTIQCNKYLMTHLTIYGQVAEFHSVIVMSMLYFSDRGIIRDGIGPNAYSEHAA